MRYVPVEQIEKNMILAMPVHSDNGTILLKAGSTISENAIKHIENMGMQGIYIEQKGFEDIKIENPVSETIRMKAYNSLAKGDYDTCVSLSKDIVSEIKYSKNKTVNIIDIKSFKNYEYYHCVSVAIYSTCMGIAMKMNDEQIEKLAIAGMLHDIGKFDVKRRVLNSKNVYNDKQMDEMMKHPMYSYETLKEYPNVSSVSRNSILFHHENIDGTGYYKVSGEKLGLFPRILRVVDTYDALTASRRHRAAFSPAYAFRNLAENAGVIYDKEVVRTFINLFPMYPLGYPVKLSNGMQGVVVGHTEDMECPVIRTFDGETINLFDDITYRGVVILED